MARTILLLTFLLGIAVGRGQPVPEKVADSTLKSVIRDILELAVDRNVAAIDEKYVHPELGVFDIYRIGVPDVFREQKSIAFAFPIEENSLMYPNLNDIGDQHLGLALLPFDAVFDCYEERWNAKGLFYTDSAPYPILSRTIEQPVYEGAELPENMEEKVKCIEEHSYRVVVTEMDVIFHISQINGRWYLTLFDRVATDCSA